MSGVYGDFMENFPELLETFYHWREWGDRANAKLVKAIYMPNKGDGMTRRKYTSGNTGHDMKEQDEFWINHFYDSTVKTGDYIQKEGDNIIMRLTHLMPYDKAAGYRVYAIERVTGTTEDKTEQLPVKEGYFA